MLQYEQLTNVMDCHYYENDQECVEASSFFTECAELRALQTQKDELSQVPNHFTSRENDLAYWCAQLADLPCLSLPCDYPRPTIMSACVAAQPVFLSAELTHGLRGLAERGETTLFVALLSVFQLFLGRHANQDDVAVAGLIANPNHPSPNPLVFRADLRGPDLNFIKLLDKCHHTTEQAFRHQGLPFEHLARALKPKQDLSRHPLAQAMLVLEETTLDWNPGLSMTHNVMGACDLSLTLIDSPEGLHGSLEFRVDLFNKQTISSIWSRFLALVSHIVDHPESSLA